MQIDLATAAGLIVGMCLLVLLIGTMKKSKALVLNLAMRLVSGIAVIQIANYFLIMNKYEVTVGMNFISLLTSVILGFPGVILLYGIEFYKFL